MLNIQIQRCTVLNPATLFPTPADGEPHDFVASVNQVCTPRLDLGVSPLQNPEFELFVDGSALLSLVKDWWALLPLLSMRPC